MNPSYHLPSLTAMWRKIGLCHGLLLHSNLGTWASKTAMGKAQKTYSKHVQTINPNKSMNRYVHINICINMSIYIILHIYIYISTRYWGNTYIFHTRFLWVFSCTILQQNLGRIGWPTGAYQVTKPEWGCSRNRCFLESQRSKPWAFL